MKDHEQKLITAAIAFRKVGWVYERASSDPGETALLQELLKTADECLLRMRTEPGQLAWKLAREAYHLAAIDVEDVEVYADKFQKTILELADVRLLQVLDGSSWKYDHQRDRAWIDGREFAPVTPTSPDPGPAAPAAEPWLPPELKHLRDRALAVLALIEKPQAGLFTWWETLAAECRRLKNAIDQVQR